METNNDPDKRTTLLEDWYDYWLDAMQRSVLFMDVLRTRGNPHRPRTG
jgi:hypothetical protein